jgi:hypothetical protein
LESSPGAAAAAAILASAQPKTIRGRREEGFWAMFTTVALFAKPTENNKRERKSQVVARF